MARLKYNQGLKKKGSVFLQTLYNNYRPHWALKMKTPNEVHLQKIPATEATGIY